MRNYIQELSDLHLTIPDIQNALSFEISRELLMDLLDADSVNTYSQVISDTLYEELDNLIAQYRDFPKIIKFPKNYKISE